MPVAGASCAGLTRNAPRVAMRAVSAPVVQRRFQTIRHFTSLVVKANNTFGGTDYRFPSDEDSAANAVGINDGGTAVGECQPYVMDRTKYNPTTGHMDLSAAGDC